MRKVLIGLAVLPFLTAVAGAAEPLTNQQMDHVTAGFSALSVADAEGLVGSGSLVLTTTASLSQVSPFASATLNETSFTVNKSLSAAQSSTVTSTLPTIALALSHP